MIYTMFLQYKYTNVPYIYRVCTVYQPYIYRSYENARKCEGKGEGILVIEGGKELGVGGMLAFK